MTIEEHALAHYELYQKFGKLEDKIAWLCLSGKTEEGERERIRLAQIKSELHRKSEKFSETKEKISKSLKDYYNTNPNSTKGKKRPEVSKILIEKYKNGELISSLHKLPRDFFVDNCIKNQKILIAGRKASKKWKESVTSQEYRDKKSEIHKEIVKAGIVFHQTHKDNISKAKRGNNYNAKPISIDGQTFPCVNEAARLTGIKASKLRYRAKSDNFKNIFYI